MTSRRRSSSPLAASLGCALIAASASALGCGSDDGGSNPGPPPPAGGQTGEEGVGCLPVERDMLAWSERSTLGFSADELLNALGSESPDRLTWNDGGSVPLMLGIQRDATGSVEFQTRDYVSDNSGAEPAAEIATECNDVLAIPITLSFATSDGAFAEQWSLTLLAESSTRASAYIEVDVDELDGSYSVSEVDPSRFDRILASLQLTFADGVWTGTLSGQGITNGSGDPDGASSATAFAIASF